MFLVESYKKTKSVNKIDTASEKKMLQAKNNEQKSHQLAETFEPIQSDTTTIPEEAKSETSEETAEEVGKDIKQHKFQENTQRFLPNCRFLIKNIVERFHTHSP